MTSKNLGWVSLVSKSGNTVLVVTEKPETPRARASEQETERQREPQQQLKKKPRVSGAAKAASPSERVSAAANATGAAASRLSKRDRESVRSRNLKPGVWQKWQASTSTQPDGSNDDGWSNLPGSVADAYEAAWQAGADTAEYSGKVGRSTHYIAVDFGVDTSGFFRQVDYRDDKEARALLPPPPPTPFCPIN